jgi:mannosyltransferase OCH1-like enzyme
MINDIKFFYQVWEPITSNASKKIPDFIMEKNNLHIPKDLEYKLFSLEDMINYLKKNWGEEYVSVFNNYEKIAHKTDLWRYCILYDTGGIYMDADCILLNILI